MHDLALLAVIGIVSLPNLFWLLPVPLLVLATFRQLLRAVATDAQAQPFTLTLVPIFLGYSGLGISLWPNIVPPSLDFRAAAEPGLHAGRRAVHHSLHPRLHRLELLCVPRQEVDAGYH